jgi:outer membrane protein assembly factor BamB
MGRVGRSTLLIVAAATLLLAGLPTIATNASQRGGKATPYDVATYGYSALRTNNDALETTLGTSNVGSLQEAWSFDAGAVILTEPLYAAGVTINSVPTDVVYIGSEHGDLYALDAGDGTILWQRNVGTATQSNCLMTPDGVYGVGGTPVFDRTANRIYVAGGSGRVYALDMSSGAIQPGWPVKVISQPTLNYVWGALNLSAGKLYVPVGGLCDITPYHGHLAEIDVTTAKEIGNWIVNGSYSGPNGGAIWGYGGVSLNPASGNIFAATGNAIGSNEHVDYSEHVVELNASLAVQASNYPGLTGSDVDFGATPALFKPPGCKDKLAVVNKSGQLFLYNRGTIASGPVQTLQISKEGVFIGVTAYSPTTNMLYVPNPNDSASGTYKHGLVALTFGTGCTLSLKWQATVGVNKTSVASPIVANGVVYYGDGSKDQVFAFNAATGAQLWNSGTTITGAVYGTPTVADGMLFVGAWDHHLHAFAPSS